MGAVVAFTDITDRKLAEAALANVSRKLIEAQEQERARIGRELHDDIGQRLALLAAGLQQLQESPLIVPEVYRRLGDLEKQISDIASDIQLLSHELHSAKLQCLGIAGAVRGFCRKFSKQQRVEIDVQTDALPDLSADISLCLFRVLQEALRNSANYKTRLRYRTTSPIGSRCCYPAARTEPLSTGTRAWIVAPPLGWVSIVKVPFTSFSRSSMLTSPKRLLIFACSRSKPTPESLTVRCISFAAHHNRTSKCRTRTCLDRELWMVRRSC